MRGALLGLNLFVESGILMIRRGVNHMRKYSFALAVLLLCAAPGRAQNKQDKNKPKQNDSAFNQVVDRIVARENAEMDTIRQYSPLVETYIQNTKVDKEEGWLPDGDRYFLGRAQFGKNVELESLSQQNASRHMFGSLGGLLGAEILPKDFVEMIYLDVNGLNRQDYEFDYVHREFLGEVRTLVFDVTPVDIHKKGHFVGRIWVEDQNFTIVRFNGVYIGNFHFDSWRVNVGPNLWLPAFIYSEETRDKHADRGTPSFKAQTRLWGYNLDRNQQSQDLADALLEANSPNKNQNPQDTHLSGEQAVRNWKREAENSVVDRLQRTGLIAPEGEVDKALDTIVNNLEITNDLDIQPEVRCRVLMTSTIESFNVGHTIIMSRGLIDVLPDEASFATMLAQELAHIVLGHGANSQFAFFDKVLLYDEKETFKHFDFERTKEEDDAASVKAAELLKKSPYKDQLKTPQLFLAELESRAKEVPNLISPKMGNAVLAQEPIAADKTSKPAESQIVALPLGGRIKLDPWTDKLELIKSTPAGNIAEREKMPFEVTPFMPYLTRWSAAPPQAAVNAPPKPN